MWFYVLQLVRELQMMSSEYFQLLIVPAVNKVFSVFMRVCLFGQMACCCQSYISIYFDGVHIFPPGRTDGLELVFY